ncbi:phosphoribosyl-AMP cyclohydrolase [candidate division FCPU426 bacterium]|nr:phosphoribosyl-AMP cyclohydrolase [candidate division FCPU426 bacterium]
MSLPPGMKFNKDGLLVAIVQDSKNHEVLMQAFMNEEAMRLTLATGIAHYFSRSRNTLWKKGETSGHVQYVKEMRVDCDQDAVLLKVEQVGAACHAGFRSCFYRLVGADGSLREEGDKIFDPQQK